MTTLLTPAICDGTVGWYLPPSFDTSLLKDAANSAPFVVSKGRDGARLLSEVVSLSEPPPVAFDPAQYEAAKVRGDRVRRRGWAELEAALGVTAFVSPGTFLHPDMTQNEARAALAREHEWVRNCDGHGCRVFLAVAVDARFLRDRSRDLVKAFRSMDCDIWLTLSGRNDPLALLGTVEALVHILSACHRVAVMRCDIGALGGLAFGALMGTIGLTGAVRHSPDGGGGTRNGIPVVYVRTLQSFRKLNLLQSWVQRDEDIEYDLLCSEECCDGNSILRFADPAYADDAMRHNMLSLRAEIDGVYLLDPDLRRQKFVSLAKHAWFQHERLADSVDTIKADPQLRQWAQLEI